MKIISMKMPRKDVIKGVIRGRGELRGEVNSLDDKEKGMNQLFLFVVRNKKALFFLIFMITAMLAFILPAVIIPKLNPLVEFAPR